MRVSAARVAKLLGLGAVLVSAALWTEVAKASVITDDFTFSLKGATVASGSFSYDSSLSSVVGYGDVFSFSINIPGAGQNYSLGFPATDYAYFDYNPGTNSFVASNVTGQEGTFNELMGAAISTGGTLTSGFFISPSSPPPGVVETFPFQFATYDTVTIDTVSVSNVPEPNSLALLGAAIVAFGFLLRRRRAAAPPAV